MTEKNQKTKATENVSSKDQAPMTAIVAPPEIDKDEDLIQQAVKLINDTFYETEKSNVKWIEVGEFILDKFFHNDPQLAFSKRGDKGESFRKLSDSDKIQVSHVTINQAVRAAYQEREFAQRNYENRDKLTYTHKVILSRISDYQEKIKLANDCVEEELTTRNLQEKVALLIKENAKKNEPSPSFVARKFFVGLKKPISGLKIPDKLLEPQQIETLTTKTKEKLSGQVKSIIEQLKDLTEKYLALDNRIEQAKKVTSKGGEKKSTAENRQSTESTAPPVSGKEDSSTPKQAVNN